MSMRQRKPPSCQSPRPQSLPLHLGLAFQLINLPQKSAVPSLTHPMNVLPTSGPSHLPFRAASISAFSLGLIPFFLSLSCSPSDIPAMSKILACQLIARCESSVDSVEKVEVRRPSELASAKGTKVTGFEALVWSMWDKVRRDKPREGRSLLRRLVTRVAGECFGGRAKATWRVREIGGGAASSGELPRLRLKRLKRLMLLLRELDSAIAGERACLAR